jgi:hypothetical protein
VVSRIEGDTVEMNGGGLVTDRLGNIQSRKGRPWEDAQFFPAEYKVGKRWKLRMHIATDAFEDDLELDAVVAAREAVAVGAGEFQVFRVEIGGYDKMRRRYAWTYWMHPRYGMPIRWTEARYNPRGQVRKSVDFELISLRAPRG